MQGCEGVYLLCGTKNADFRSCHRIGWRHRDRRTLYRRIKKLSVRNFDCIFDHLLCVSQSDAPGEDQIHVLVFFPSFPSNTHQQSNHCTTKQAPQAVYGNIGHLTASPGHKGLMKLIGYGIQDSPQPAIEPVNTFNLLSNLILSPAYPSLTIHIAQTERIRFLSLVWHSPCQHSHFQSLIYCSSLVCSFYSFRIANPLQI